MTERNSVPCCHHKHPWVTFIATKPNMLNTLKLLGHHKGICKRELIMTWSDSNCFCPWTTRFVTIGCHNLWPLPDLDQAATSFWSRNDVFSIDAQGYFWQLSFAVVMLINRPNWKRKLPAEINRQLNVIIAIQIHNSPCNWNIPKVNDAAFVSWDNKTTCCIGFQSKYFALLSDVQENNKLWWNSRNFSQ